MPTAAEFAFITDKKLLGFTDFDVYFLKYLRNEIRQGISRQFVQGSFDEAMPLSSPGANQVQVDLKPILLDGFAHDGAGHILDLDQIDRTANFENIAAQVYEVGARYVEYPKEIRINPRTGKPEYDRYVEGIGREAIPDLVTVGGSTLTFRVDSLFEQGGGVNHTGRQVRVFRIVPGDVATSEAVAIETATVFFGGGQNQITTVGLLGQSVADSNPNFYVVQLIGITVFKDNAANRPTQEPDETFFVGTVTGNGGTPTVFDVSGQTLIHSAAAGDIDVLALGNWADGTTNPAANLQTVLAKIVADLTSTTGGWGAAKVSAVPAATEYAPLPGVHVGDQLAEIQAYLQELEFQRQSGREIVALTQLREITPEGIFAADGAGLVVGSNPVNSAMYLSNDAAVWVAASGFTFGGTVYALKYVNGRFMVAGVNANVDSSVDGDTWGTSTTSGMGSGESLSQIEFGNAIYIAGALSAYLTSPDAVTWTYFNPGAYAGYCRLAFGVGLFLSTKLIASSTYLTSPDTVTWTPHSFPASYTVSSIRYVTGLGFVAAARSGTTRLVIRSTDGINWTTLHSAVQGLSTDFDVIIAGQHYMYSIPANGTSKLKAWMFKAGVYETSRDFIVANMAMTTDVVSGETILDPNQVVPDFVRLAVNASFFFTQGNISHLATD